MRPNAQTVPNGNIAPFIGTDLNDEFFSDLDKAFEQIQMAPKTASRKKNRRTRKTAAGIAEMRETFIEVSQVHLRPVLRYLKAIQMGVASKDLCEIVHYVIGPIIGKTRKVGLVEHTKALIGFQRALKEAVKSPSRKLTEEQRVKLASYFAAVQKEFDLDIRGHSTAVVNLLGFYRAINRKKDVAGGDIQKLFAIGIPSITMLRKSSIAELVSLSGIHPSRITSLRWQARNFNLLSLV